MFISELCESSARLMAVIAAVAVLLGGLAACDNPVENHDSEHAEADGFVLLADGAEILRADPVARDTLFVPLDDTTDVITVEFIDEEGHEIHAEDLEHDFELVADVVDADVLEILPRGPWSFTLRGLQAETTAVMIGLLHDTHDEFRPRDVPVVVR